MTVILSRSCPRCRGYFTVVIAESKGRRKSQPINGRCAFCGYKIQWRLLAGYGNQSSKNSGPKPDALTAEKVFGWKKVHKHQGALVRRKQDKAGRWRRAKVPNYSTNPLHSYSVENRMKQLGRSDRYQKELSKLTRSKNIPSDWASPDQRCRAAIKAVGQYGQVIPLRGNRNRIGK